MSMSQRNMILEVQEIKESMFDLNDSAEKAFSYFEVINRSVSEMESHHPVTVESGDRYSYRPQVSMGHGPASRRASKAHRAGINTSVACKDNLCKS